MLQGSGFSGIPRYITYNSTSIPTLTLNNNYAGAGLRITTASSGNQLKLGLGGTFEYTLGRDTNTGFLNFKGNQSGFTGYEFFSDDGSTLVEINDAGNMDVLGTVDAGVAQIGTWSANGDYAFFGHNTRNTANGYAILQESSGETFVNSENGQNLHLRVGNVDEIIVTGNNSQFGSSQKILINPDYAGSGDLPAGGFIGGNAVTGGLSIIPDSSGTSTRKVVLAYYNGSTWKSILEYANTTGAALGTLTLAKGGETTSIGGVTTVTANSASSALTVNQQSNGPLFQVQDNGTPVFNIIDGGEAQILNEKSLKLYSATGNMTFWQSGTTSNLSASNAMSFIANNGAGTFYSTAQFLIQSTTSYVHLLAAAGQHQYFDCGGYWYWRDVDAGSANRMTFGSQYGDLTLNGYQLITANTASNAITINQQSTGNIIEAQDNGTSVFVVEDGGNVAIGNVNANQKLHIHESSSGLAYAHWTNTTTGTGQFSDGLLIGISANEQAIFLNYENTDMLFYTNGTTNFRIRNTGGIVLPNDNQELEFGGGNDASIYYDGSHLYINSDKAGSGSTRIGDSTNHVEVEPDGDVNFAGGGGLQFGQIYEEDGSSTLALAAQDTFYQVTAFSINGESNGDVTPDHTNDHITVGKAGKYLVSINISFSQTTAVSIEYDFHVFTNNGANEFVQVSAHRDTNGANTVGSCSATGIIDVSANDTIELWVARRTGAAVSRTITFSTVSLNVVQIGG